MPYLRPPAGDMAFRAFSAAVGGHMGMELDLRSLTADETATLAAAIAFHISWRTCCTPAASTGWRPIRRCPDR